MATSEASKEIQLDRINNKINFLNTEIKRTINQMNNIYLEIDNENENSKEYNSVSMGNLEMKRREYDDKKNHLMSCITSLEAQINKIPIQEEEYSEEFIEDFLNRVKELEKRKGDENEVVSISSVSPPSNYVKTKSGLIVPREKELKQLRASSTGYVCRAETFCKLLLRVIDNYKCVYLWGGNGQLITRNGKKRWGFDCSGFLRAVLWGWCGDDSQKYGGSCLGKGSIVPYHTSSYMIKSCPGGGTTDFSNIVPGECVWFSGHVGAYIGSGRCAESSPSGADGPQVTVLANNPQGAMGRKKTWTKHGKFPYIDYSNTMTDNLGNGWIAGAGSGGMATSSGVIAEYGYINGLNMSDLYESDNYYGYGEKTEFIARTEDSSIVRVVVSKSTSVASLAKSLSMTSSNLLELNPSLKSSSSSGASSVASSSTSSSMISAGTSIYIPASTYTAAKEMATSSYNTASAQIDEMNNILSGFKNETQTITTAAYTASASKIASTSVNTVLTTASSSIASSSVASSKSTNYATTSSDGQTNSEKMREYKSWTRIYDTGYYKDYANARIIITKDGKTRVLRTVISPTGYSETYSNSLNLQQTTGGWFMARHGENPVNLTVTGVMLDTDANPEKHDFIKEWKNYLTDKQSTKTGLFYNKSSVKIQLEGIRYEGVINNISFQKNANTPSLYNFTMNFSCVSYKITRSITSAVKRLGKKGSSSSSSSKASSSTVSLSSGSSTKTKAIASNLLKTMTTK